METTGHSRQEGDAGDPLAMCRVRVAGLYLADEPERVKALLSGARPDPALAEPVGATARRLVDSLRAAQKDQGGLRAFLSHYDLSSREGIVLMCLAESLLRIPDPDTADRLIADKLTSADWRRHLGASHSLFVNASTWALMLTGGMLEVGEQAQQNPAQYLAALSSRMEEPVLRSALRAAMGIMARQFVMGRDIGEALTRSRAAGNSKWRYSFDMLGEAALTGADARAYEQSYSDAIHRLQSAVVGSAAPADRPGISVKLSALCPRFEFAQRRRALDELSGRLGRLCESARDAGIALTVDAEEADRLELTLEVFERAWLDHSSKRWSGLGIAVQAYQKRAAAVLEWLEQLAANGPCRIPVRLVKGAYWDTEIKRAQEHGLRDYPVFTRKCNTDVSYLACARILLERCPHLYPQFASHNAHTVAWVYHHAGKRDYEFQRLHGMGADLYAPVIAADGLNVPCRVYAPVGAHRHLLPYLVRRLLENGANTSFVNLAVHDSVDPDRLAADPVRRVEALGERLRHPAIPKPADMYLPERVNSAGINFSDERELTSLVGAVQSAAAESWAAAARVNGKLRDDGREYRVADPARTDRIVGRVVYAAPAVANQALETVHDAWFDWNRTGAAERARILERAAVIFEQRRAELMARCVRECGKTLRDSYGEVREAVDFLRYYAAQCRKLFGDPSSLPGPTGESNTLQLQGRGVFLCISPWNFPVSIFTGQVAAALAAGNTVIAKPAEQASLTGALAADLLFEAGVPAQVLAFLPGDGPALGAALLSDPRLAGVAFTGGTETGRAINRGLAARDGPLATLIAETGGQNVLVADSSALPEQLVHDAIASAFNSAGQRCSALRVLFLQEEIAARSLDLLTGAMDELVIGDPMALSTDVGPLIDRVARDVVNAHIDAARAQKRLLHECARAPGMENGHFIAPAVVELDRLDRLEREVFGPVLHVVRYHPDQLDAVIDAINATGYGLTSGIHSRIQDTVEYIQQRVRAGNVYVNRNMIGAVVGVQPFGGRGLSGTGPKAGGPHYLPRFATEQTCSVNTAAVGGNASLLVMGDD